MLLEGVGEMKLYSESLSQENPGLSQNHSVGIKNIDLGSESLNSSPGLSSFKVETKQLLICRIGIVIVSFTFPGKNKCDSGCARGLENLAHNIGSLNGSSHECLRLWELANFPTRVLWAIENLCSAHSEHFIDTT